MIKSDEVNIEALQAELQQLRLKVAELEQAGQVQRENNAILLNFFNRTPVMLGIVEVPEQDGPAGPDMFHLSDNAATASFFGLESAEVMSRKWASAMGVPLKQRRLWVEHYRESRRSGQPVSFEYSHTNSSGVHWLSVMVSHTGEGLEGRARFSYIVEDITERKRIENALRESESRFYRFFHLAPMPISLTRFSDGRLIDVNSAFLAFSGLSRAGALGLTTIEALGFAPEERQRMLDLVEKTGQANNFETTMITKTGAALRVMVSSQALEFGPEKCLLTTYYDISPVKAAEEERARRQYEARLRFQAEVLGQINDAVLVHDNEMRITYLNQAAEQAYGLSEAEAKGQPMNRLFRTALENGAEPEPEKIARILRETGSWRGEVIHLKNNGQASYVEVNATQLRDSQNRPDGVLAVIRDISERKRAENSLLLLSEAGAVMVSSLQYSTMLEQLARLSISRLAGWCVIATAGEDGRAEQVIAAHPDPAQEALLKEVVPGLFSGPRASTLVDRVIRSGRAEVMPEVPAGSPFETLSAQPEYAGRLNPLIPRSVMVVPLVARGRTLGAMAFVSLEPGRFTPATLPLAEELARRAALAVDNARLYQAAQQALQVRDNFLHIAVHELRTPLTVLKIGVQSLERSVDRAGAQPEKLDLAKTRQHLDQAIKMARRLERIIDDMADATDIASDELYLDWQTVDLARLVEELVQDESCRDQRYRLELEVDRPGLPLPVRVDPLKLKKALLKLIDNALKFSPEDTSVRLTLRPDATGTAARLYIRDSGPGIDPALREQLFQPYYQADNYYRTRRFGGLGLGLFTCKALLEAHAARLQLLPDDPARPGSCFLVELPLSRNND